MDEKEKSGWAERTRSATGKILTASAVALGATTYGVKSALDTELNGPSPASQQPRAIDNLYKLIKKAVGQVETNLNSEEKLPEAALKAVLAHAQRCNRRTVANGIELCLNAAGEIQEENPGEAQAFLKIARALQNLAANWTADKDWSNLEERKPTGEPLAADRISHKLISGLAEQHR